MKERNRNRIEKGSLLSYGHSWELQTLGRVKIVQLGEELMNIWSKTRGGL
jgi:hypothetical protein